MKKNKNLILIIARTGTKDISKQNIRLVDNRPLVYYVIDRCLKNKNSDVFVSSDSEEIMQISNFFGANFLVRPKRLTKDRTTIEDIAYHTLNELKKRKYQYEKCLIVNPHFPLIKSSKIDRFFSMIKNNVKTVYGFQEDDSIEYLRIRRKGNVNRLTKVQDSIVKKNKIVSFSCKDFLKNKRFSDDVYGIKIDKSEIFTPESYHDFGVLENVLNRKRILVRVDGSKKIGLGHVYNMLTVLNQFRNEDILILMSERNSLGREKFKENLYDVKLVSNNIQFFNEIKKFKPDIIFNDILNTDISYMKKLKTTKAFIVNFEDLGIGRKYADLVINPIFSSVRRFSNEYYGSEYACVRDEFRIFDRNEIRKKIQKICITLGGVDDKNNTHRIMHIIHKNKILEDVEINIILGFGFRHKEKLMKLVNFMRKDGYCINIIEKTDFISRYILDCDFVIASNGRTIFEIASLKIPIISLSVNPRETHHNFVKETKTGYKINILEIDLENVLIRSISNMRKFETRKRFFNNLEKVDLKNGIKRVVHMINFSYDAKKIGIKF